MPQHYVILPNRSLPLRLPTGHILLVSVTDKVIGMYWFEGSIKSEPYRTVRLNIGDDPNLEHVFKNGAWDVLLVLDLAWRYALKGEGDKGL